MKATVGHMRALSVSKEVAAFERAAEAYVKKATSSAKAASAALVRIGTHDAKGKLTKPYR